MEQMPEAMIRKLHSILPGEMVIYFIGLLDEERTHNPRGGNCIIATVAYELYQQGKLTLVQKRAAGPGSGFMYIAIGSKPKRKIGP